MEDTVGTHFHKVGVILILTLLLPFTWKLIPASIEWGFPFFDNTTRGFALQPIEYRVYQLRNIIPFYQFGFIGCVYMYCKGIVPQMHVGIFGKTIDIWFLYILYLALQSIDLFLAFLQFPYYRMVMTLIILFTHIKFLINKK